MGEVVSSCLFGLGDSFVHELKLESRDDILRFELLAPASISGTHAAPKLLFLSLRLDIRGLNGCAKINRAETMFGVSLCPLPPLLFSPPH
jgi:hypothetical protein